jgi:hypothetical protein
MPKQRERCLFTILIFTALIYVANLNRHDYYYRHYTLIVPIRHYST